MNSSSNVSHLQPRSSDKVELHPSVSAWVSCGLHIPNSQTAALFASSVHDKKICAQAYSTVFFVIKS